MQALPPTAYVELREETEMEREKEAGFCGNLGRLQARWAAEKKKPAVKATLLVWSVLVFALKLTWAIFVSLQVSRYYQQMNDIQSQLDALQANTATTSQRVVQLESLVTGLETKTDALDEDITRSQTMISSV